MLTTIFDIINQIHDTSGDGENYGTASLFHISLPTRHMADKYCAEPLAYEAKRTRRRILGSFLVGGGKEER